MRNSSSYYIVRRSRMRRNLEKKIRKRLQLYLTFVVLVLWLGEISKICKSRLTARPVSQHLWPLKEKKRRVRGKASKNRCWEVNRIALCKANDLRWNLHHRKGWISGKTRNEYGCQARLLHDSWQSLFADIIQALLKLPPQSPRAELPGFWQNYWQLFEEDVLLCSCLSKCTLLRIWRRGCEAAIRQLLRLLTPGRANDTSAGCGSIWNRHNQLSSDFAHAGLLSVNHAKIPWYFRFSKSWEFLRTKNAASIKNLQRRRHPQSLLHILRGHKSWEVKNWNTEKIELSL